ncbi:hypothetical protein BDF22DRAFT_740658 [Syncephalis plumigaleata]|nr:hypothetical protein BDF22DRAFT_740658 [Syncephalis plumigaleata]
MSLHQRSNTSTSSNGQTSSILNANKEVDKRHDYRVWQPLSLSTYIANLLMVGLIVSIYVVPHSMAPWPVSFIQRCLGTFYIGVPFWILLFCHFTETYIATIICCRRGYTWPTTIACMASTMLCGVNCLLPLVGRSTRPEYFKRLPLATYIAFVYWASSLSMPIAYLS